MAAPGPEASRKQDECNRPMRETIKTRVTRLLSLRKKDVAALQALVKLLPDKMSGQQESDLNHALEIMTRW